MTLTAEENWDVLLLMSQADKGQLKWLSNSLLTCPELYPADNSVGILCIVFFSVGTCILLILEQSDTKFLALMVGIESFFWNLSSPTVHYLFVSRTS